MSKKSLGKVFFSHGKESGPGAFKIQRLSAIARQAGFETTSIDYRGISDPHERISKLLRNLEYENDEKLILAGSSMGAFVSIAASESINPAGLFLMAPAVYIEGYDYPEMKPAADVTEVIHGWKDEIVPAENVFRFCSEYSLNLKFLNDTHNLQSSIKEIEVIFKEFLNKVANLI